MSAGMDERGDERDLRAAEYVLGTLPAAERAAMDLELTVDPATAAAVRAWEGRLLPLGAAVLAVNPPPGVWPTIEAALAGRRAAPVPPANDNRIEELSRKVRRWRWVAGGASALAAGLALFIAVDIPPSRTAPERYVAVVNRGGELPALLVSIDTGTGTAQVRPVGAETPAGRSLELWYIGAGQAPKPLGLIGADAQRLTLPSGTDAAALSGAAFAVSVEPPGGSPTGQPTGPVVYQGKLIRD